MWWASIHCMPSTHATRNTRARTAHRAGSFSTCCISTSTRPWNRMIARRRARRSPIRSFRPRCAHCAPTRLWIIRPSPRASCACWNCCFAVLARHLDTPSERGRAFHVYRAAQGENLRLYALFEALHEHLHAADPEMWGWPVWPEAYRDPYSQAVAAFAVEKASRIEFFEYLQWLAEEQLDAVGRRSLERHLDVGVYTDLAVGADSGGAEVWSNQSLYALDARIGAPPDGFNLKGQNWGLPPLKPNALIDSAYAPYIAALRHNMRHAGALRIDHVMGLLRLFWVPPGRPPDDGSYVTYPLHDMLVILALESRRNRCLVICEDLGTVPHEVREALQAVGALSYRLLYFEKDAEGDFLPPAEFPAQAAVAISTHDLPPLNAFWRGTDLERRAEFGLFPNDTVRKQHIVGRAQDRAQ